MSSGIDIRLDINDIVVDVKNVIMKLEIGYEKIQKYLVRLIKNIMNPIRIRYYTITIRDERINDMIKYKRLLGERQKSYELDQLNALYVEQAM